MSEEVDKPGASEAPVGHMILRWHHGVEAAYLVIHAPSGAWIAVPIECGALNEERALLFEWRQLRGWRKAEVGLDFSVRRSRLPPVVRLALREGELPDAERLTLVEEIVRAGWEEGADGWAVLEQVYRAVTGLPLLEPLEEQEAEDDKTRTSGEVRGTGAPDPGPGTGVGLRDDE